METLYIFLRIRNVLDEICREKQHTFSVQKLFSENCAFYEIMWKKYDTARQATDDNIIRHMRVAC